MYGAGFPLTQFLVELASIGRCLVPLPGSISPLAPTKQWLQFLQFCFGPPKQIYIYIYIKKNPHGIRSFGGYVPDFPTPQRPANAGGGGGFLLVFHVSYPEKRVRLSTSFAHKKEKRKSVRRWCWARIPPTGRRCKPLCSTSRAG